MTNQLSVVVGVVAGVVVGVVASVIAVVDRYKTVLVHRFIFGLSVFLWFSFLGVSLGFSGWI